MSSPTFRDLPAVAAVLESAALIEVRRHLPPADVTAAIRAELDSLRSQMKNGSRVDLSLEPLAQRVLDRLHVTSQPTLRPVINATGIVLHTNLGRSCLAESAVSAVWRAARGYLNLELNLETGKRSHRSDAIRDGLRRLTGAESGTAVNNCAAATILVLKSLAFGKEAIVSRGQLVEIGGSFRIPEIMAASGAILKEVGTTNITRLSDYERAIGPNTGLIIRVHPSNFRIRGFTETPEIEELAALGKKHNLPVVDDVGSGLSIDLTPFGFPAEPTVADGIRAGADLVLFSGDKLLGGPQAGLIAGRADLVKRIETDPFMRAFRLDKMTLAALEATLRLYRDPARALREIPTLRMLTTPVAELQSRAETLASRLREIPNLSIRVDTDSTYVGGGSMPDHPIPTVVIVANAQGISEEEFASRLRRGTPSVMARSRDGSVIFDLRTVEPDHFDALSTAITVAAAAS
ncbi:MAG: L-seryl-tRNA(Sec) selenium transferase [Gemmataceae bacterium]